MSFSIIAIGSRDHVIAQLKAHDLSNGAALAEKARSIALDTLTESPAHGEADYTWAYTVRISGHDGSYDRGTPASLTVSVEPQWVLDVSQNDGQDKEPATA
jgi:hypothetical protein